MVTYKPIGDKVLIRRDKDDVASEYSTSSGIVVVNKEEMRHKGRVSIGTVEAIGTNFINNFGELEEISKNIKVGDKVLYYHAAEIDLHDDDLILIRAIDIDCIVDSDAKLGR